MKVIFQISDRFNKSVQIYADDGKILDEFLQAVAIVDLGLQQRADVGHGFFSSNRRTYDRRKTLASLATNTAMCL